jgi:hypothetical protein
LCKQPLGQGGQEALIGGDRENAQGRLLQNSARITPLRKTSSACSRSAGVER